MSEGGIGPESLRSPHPRFRGVIGLARYPGTRASNVVIREALAEPAAVSRTARSPTTRPGHCPPAVPGSIAHGRE